MVNKSNEYGYIPSSPTQAIGANTGIFEVNDVTDLLNAGQWSGDFGALTLIETKTPSGVTEVIFTDLQTSKYNIHFLTITNFQPTVDTKDLRVRFFESGVEEAGSVYRVAYRYGSNGSSHGEVVDTSRDHLRATFTTGNATNEAANSYLYLYNLGDNTMRSFITQHGQMENGAPSHYFQFGGGVMNQSSEVDQIKLYTDSGNYSASISLYGISHENTNV